MSNEALNTGSPEPIILAIESATRAGSVALARGDSILASTAGDASSSHSTDLIENLDSVIRQAGVVLRDVDLFAAAVGPGSFTGLRIGLATIKSLAVSLSRQCVGVSTLAAIAHAGGASERTIALLPAGRGEVFAQMFAVSANLVEPLDEPAHISPAAMLARYGAYQPLLWAGDGALSQLDLLRTEAQARGIDLRERSESNGFAWVVSRPTGRLAEAVAELAGREWRNGNVVDPEELRANYVRPSDAEIKSHG